MKVKSRAASCPQDLDVEAQEASKRLLTSHTLSEMVLSRQKNLLMNEYAGPEGLASLLHCNPAVGLDTDTIVENQRYGSNESPIPPRPSFLRLLIQGLRDVVLLMLIFSAVLSLILGLAVEKDYQHGWVEGASILGTVCLVVLVGAATDYSKASEFRQQQIELDTHKEVNVIREGESRTIHPKNLVVGDIARLNIGDIVCADGILIESSTGLKFDESALTGETKLIKKQPERDVFILSGSSVMMGSGRMIVVAVGDYSMQGKILARLRAEHDITSDLITKLNRLALLIGKVAILVSSAVFIVMTSRWSIIEWGYDSDCQVSNRYNLTCSAVSGCMIDDDGDCVRHWISSDLTDLLEYFITAITILVVAVPEGLPLAVTLSLAVSMRRMTRDNNQVKTLDSCETMGNATTICSDKTGTLTENRMTVMKATLLHGNRSFEYTPELEDCANLADVMKQSLSSDWIELICEALILNASPMSRIIWQEGGPPKYLGNATECALLKLAKQFGHDAEEVRERYRESSSGSNPDWGVHAVPFSSETKQMKWVVSRGPNKLRMYIKGAPMKLIQMISSAEERKRLKKVVEKYQRLGMRTLAIGYRDFARNDKKLPPDNKINLIGLLALEDPVRASVPRSIRNCNRASIQVRMLTGDALLCAISIARQVNILLERDLDSLGNVKPGFAMTGAEFAERVHLKDTTGRKVMRRAFNFETGEAEERLAYPFKFDGNHRKILDREAFDMVWPRLKVLARCLPEDKLTLVQGMQQSEVFKDKERCRTLKEEDGIEIFPDYQVVAVTGDGTNDAPALKCSNVGFAMGICGTDIAKQACDIILLDDNFTSIVKAVMWGRNVFDSISKFIQFQLTVNVVAITVACIGAFVYNQSPLSAVQMLWVNMIMDSLASLALATELPTEELLDREPYGKKRSVISRIMYCNILGQSIYQLIVLLIVLFKPELFNIEYDPTSGSIHWTFFFNVFVLLQLMNEFNSRKLPTVEGLRCSWRNWNVFEGLFRNAMFIKVWVVSFALQVVFLCFGGDAINVSQNGLTPTQWMDCILLSFGVLVWQVLAINPFILFSAGGTRTVVAQVDEKEDDAKKLDLMELQPAAPHEY